MHDAFDTSYHNPRLLRGPRSRLAWPVAPPWTCLPPGAEPKGLAVITAIVASLYMLFVSIILLTLLISIIARWGWVPPATAARGVRLSAAEA